MLRIRQFSLLLIPLLHADDVWKTKRAADWTASEIRQILTDSPWGAMVTPTIKKETQRQAGNHGLGIGGVPGMGHRRPADQAQSPTETTNDSPQPLNVRWESALPIREAELKARETSAPDVDENHYAIAVYGIPTRLAKPDAQSFGDRLKGQASIKREGQKEIKPSGVQVIQRDTDLVVVFLFPRTREISAKDGHADFEAQIGPYQVAQPFHVDEMTYQGKTEL